MTRLRTSPVAPAPTRAASRSVVLMLLAGWLLGFGLSTSARAADPTKEEMIKALTPVPDSEFEFRGGPGESSTPGAGAKLPLIINFEVGSAAIREDSKSLVRQLAAALTAPELLPYRFEIGGHTDISGAYGKNVKLSFERAVSVRNMLINELGVASPRLTARGYGPDQLLSTQAPNSALQRRVEIVNVGEMPSATSKNVVPSPAPTPGGARGIRSDRYFGTVLNLSGQGTVFSPSAPGGTPIKPGAKLYEHDRVVTDSGSEVVVEGGDGSRIAVRPRSDLQIDAASIQGADDDHVMLKLVQGSIRSITGWITRINRKDGYQVATPIATIGVRGTDHEPFVLVSAVGQAAAGTYDKVNSGRVLLTAGGTELAIAPGQVGFAEGTGNGGMVDRGLFTLLAPVLLDRVPDFYLPGPFEKELDEYSARAEVVSQQQLQKRRASRGPQDAFRCDPEGSAKRWVASFDKAQLERDTSALVDLFDPVADFEVTARAADGSVGRTMRVRFSEFSSRLTTNLQRVTDFGQTRGPIEVRSGGEISESGCPPVSVGSEVTESGKIDGRAYRVKSYEQFDLRMDDEGRWRAIGGQTAPR